MKILKLLSLHRYFFLMVLAILLVLWPLSFFILTPKWDNVDAFLPYRYFISDYLWNGHFPFWNSFQLLGYPAYADPQSGMWNPITWGIMLFGKYTMKSLIIELLIYFVLAGMGMYWLTNTLLKNKAVASIIGLSFALSGLFVGSAQLMVFLAGTAWLPWCLCAIYKYSKTLKMKYIVLAGFFFALNTVSASPAFTIVLFYIFISWFIYLFWKNRKTRIKLKKLVSHGFFLVGIIFILLLPYIASLIEFSPYFQRVSKLPYYGGHVLNSPFTLVSYISFILPYGVISNSEVFEITNSTLRNAYIGVLGLFFFLYALVYSFRNRNVFFGFLGVAFFLIVASGGETFVYRILYYLPGFGTFSYPSFFKTYALIIMLLIAGHGIVLFSESKHRYWLNKKKSIVLLTILFCVIGISLYLNSSHEITAAFHQLINLTEFSALSLSTHLLFNLFLLTLVFIITFLIWLWLRPSLIITLFLFAFLDLGVQTMLTFPRTISYVFKYKDFEAFFKEIPNDIHQPEVNQPMEYYNDSNGLLTAPGIWYNKSTFNKTISYKGYNPFKIKFFEKALKDSSLSYNLVNPLFFFAQSERTDKNSLQKGVVWGDEFFENIEESKTLVKSIEVGYNEFNAFVVNNSNSSQWLLLNQNYYPRWKAFIDDNEVPVSLLNTNIMGIKVPSMGEYTIRFKYHAPYILYIAFINIIAFILVFLYCFKVFLHPKWKRFNQEK